MLSLLERTEPPDGQAPARSALAGRARRGRSRSTVRAAHREPARHDRRRPRDRSVVRRLRRTDQAAIARLERLRSKEPSVAASRRPVVARPGAWTERRLSALTGLPAADVESSLASLAASGALIELPVGPRRTIRVLDESVASPRGRVLRALARLHKAHPRQSAIPRARLEAALPDLENKTLVAGVLDRLKTAAS